MVSVPHGGKLIEKIACKKPSDISELPSIVLDEREVLDAENICFGAYSPLEGFMCEDEYRHVVEFMRLPNDLPWTLPIVLNASKDEIDFSVGDDVVLVYGETPIALMHVEDIYRYDKRVHALKVYKTTDVEHPSVARLYSLKEFFIGGKIELLNTIPNPFEHYTLRPKETRVLFKERGWKTIVGFQTRNAPHMGHEYVQKSALVFVDGLFINPVIGRKKKGDFKDEVILKAYDELLKHYYPRESAVLSIVRYEMRYAGPREAIHHAIMRKNFGCTHFIVGRDHAGVGNYYGPYEAQEIFREFPDLGITPLFFREFFYCRKCKAIVNEKICPHPKRYRLYFSGTMIRNMISKGERPPPEIMRPEVTEAILEFENPFVE